MTLKGIDSLLENQSVDFDGYLLIFLEYPLTYPLFYNRLKSSLVSPKLMSEDFPTRKASCLMLGPKGIIPFLRSHIFQIR
jgi:hypothetical protein